MHNIADSTGVRVMAEECKTCVFRPGNLMSLMPGRLADMVNEARGKEGVIVCHSTLDHVRQAACKGYVKRHSDASPLLQVAERLGYIVDWTIEEE